MEELKIAGKNLGITKTELVTDNATKIYTKPIFLDRVFHPEKVIINILLSIKSTNPCPKNIHTVTNLGTAWQKLITVKKTATILGHHICHVEK